MKPSSRFLALVAVLTGITHALATSTPEATPTPQIIAMQNVQGRMEELQALKPLNDLHLVSGMMGFVKANKKAIFVGLLDMMKNSLVVTKYERTKDVQSKKRQLTQHPVAVQNGLYAVKSETYNANFDGNSYSIRKAMNGRAATPFGEKVARAVGAATSPKNLNSLCPVDLYTNCIPTWVQAETAADLQTYNDWLLDELVALQVDISSIAPEARPVLLPTLKNDVLLYGLGSDMNSGLWSSLHNLHTISTFMNADMRDLFFKAKECLVDMRREAKDRGLEVGLTFGEDLFNMIAKESDFLVPKKMVLSTLKNFYEKFLKFGIPAGIAFGIWKLANWGWAKFTNKAERDAKEKAITSAANKKWAQAEYNLWEFADVVKLVEHEAKVRDRAIALSKAHDIRGRAEAPLSVNRKRTDIFNALQAAINRFDKQNEIKTEGLSKVNRALAAKVKDHKAQQQDNRKSLIQLIESLQPAA